MAWIRALWSVSQDGAGANQKILKEIRRNGSGSEVCAFASAGNALGLGRAGNGALRNGLGVGMGRITSAGNAAGNAGGAMATTPTAPRNGDRPIAIGGKRPG